MRIESALGWLPGSVLLVFSGEPPIYDIDPDGARLVVLWQTMDVARRLIVLSVAESLAQEASETKEE